VPITYQVDRAAELIRTTCTGDVTLDEVIGHFLELEADPALPAGVDVLLDLSETMSVPESEQLKAVTSEVDHLQERVRWGACAIVASRDALFGMSRMFQVFTEGLFAASHVFRELAEAERWLASRRSTRG
jgi:hypothetical protein